MKKYDTQIINEILYYASPKITLALQNELDVLKENKLFA